MEKIYSERSCEGCPYLNYQVDNKSKFLEIIHANCSYYKTSVTEYPLDNTAELAQENITKQLYEKVIASFVINASFRVPFKFRNSKNTLCKIGEEAKINSGL